MHRRLAAILAADVVDYSRLIRRDEDGTLAAFKALRRDLIDPKIAAHNGRIVKLMGDGILVEFASVTHAVLTAIELQQSIAEHNAALPESSRLAFRVGVNVGDVVVDEDDIHGDGVNVSTRLEGLARPGGVCVSGAVYDQVRDRIEAPFEDLGQQHLKNIDRPVDVWQWMPAVSPGDEAAHVSSKPGPLADRPSIAILPFNNMSGDAEQDYFVDGITEDIITELSRFRSLLVIARNSTFVYKGRSVNVGAVGREVGANYVLEGSVRRSADRVRVTAQIVEAGSGRHLWADRYDHRLDDVFALQDEITQKIVSALAILLDDAERTRRMRRSPRDPSAYDLCLRGKGLLHKGSREALLQARALFEKAVELDSNYAAAYVNLCETYFLEAMSSRDTSFEAATKKVFALSRTAAELDPLDSRAHLALAWAYLAGADDFELARNQIEEALRLNPNDFDNYCLKGWISTCSGELDDALACSNEALRRSPLVPDDCLLTRIAAEYLAENYSAAVMAFSKMRRPSPNSCAWVAAAYAQLGRVEEAQSHMEIFLQGVGSTASAQAPDDGTTWKDYWDGAFPSKIPAARDHLLDGLRKAGLTC